MKNSKLTSYYLKMVLFVLLLGAFSALILIGVDLLTKKRIASNNKIELYETIFNHNNVSYQPEEIITLFKTNSVIKVEEFYYYQEAFLDFFTIYKDHELTYFINNQNNNVTVYYQDNFNFGPGGKEQELLDVILVMDENLTTIKYLNVVHDGNNDYWGKRDLLIPEILNTITTFDFDNNLDNVTGVTHTKTSLILSLESKGKLLNKVGRKAFKKITLADINFLNENTLKEVLTNNELNLNKYLIKAYRHLESNNLSFQFRGKGMWGEISGILTLKADLMTIVNLTILEQEETPGLGALIVEREFLDQFTGKTFNPNIIINENNGPSAVDGLTGATNTSGSLQIILNEVQTLFYENYYGKKPDNLRDAYQKILAAHEIEYDEEGDDDYLITLINSHFISAEKNGLKLYTNIATNNLSFLFSPVITFGQFGDDKEEIIVVVSLEDDFKTILDLSVIFTDNTAHWGKTKFLTTKNLAHAKGFEFPNLSFNKDKNENDTSKVDNISDATTPHTLPEFEEKLNEAYRNYFNTFGGNN